MSEAERQRKMAQALEAKRIEMERASNLSPFGRDDASLQASACGETTGGRPICE